MPVSDWEDLCPHTIGWKPLASRDSYGKPTYGPEQTFRGRRSYKKRRVVSGQGDGSTVLSTSSITILGTPNVGYEDQVYVVGDAVFPPIADIQKNPDEDGDLFVRVVFGSA